jgi:mannitol/fructose-specific phosphotransferase system IIA component (Ntr-type)
MAIMFLELGLLIKVASSTLILFYILASLTLILFRESKILSYKPKFHAPLYPYLQIAGILGGLFLLAGMGWATISLTAAFLLSGFIWYKIYAQKRASQDSALIYALEKLIAKDKELASDDLLTELRDIVIERDEIIKDKFHELIEESKVLDIEEPLKMEDFFKRVSDIFSKDLGLEPGELLKKFVKREEESSTVIRKGLSIPHIIVDGKNVFKILLARAKTGVILPEDKLAHIIFVIVGSPDERNLHLKVLAAIAQITQCPEFDEKWLRARNVEELRNIVLLTERRKN